MSAPTQNSLATSFDQITVDDLRRIGGSKWTRYPDQVGAFVAEMDFGLAEPIRQRLHQAIDEGATGYISPVWDAELKQATSDYLARSYGWTVPAENILSAPDVLTGLLITMKHHISPTARVIVPTPGYMPFMFLPQSQGHELIQVPMIRTETSWELDYEALDAAFGEGDLLVLCNPHNPIGKIYRRDELEKISQIVEAHHGRVFNDEIHAPLVLPGHEHIPYPTVNQAAADHSFTAMSASKAWNLAGLKCAQFVLNDADLAGAGDYAFDLHGTATPGILANTVAFTQGEPWLADVVDYLAGNQQRLIELLAEELPGAVYIPNQGTYLAWIDCSALDLPTAPTAFFAENALVALTDGAACGEVGVGAVRLNFATPRPVLEQAVRQLGAAVRAAKGS